MTISVRLSGALSSAAPRALPSIAELQPYARCLNARLFERFQSDELPVAGKSRKYPTIGTHGGKLTTTGEFPGPSGLS
jgi:hypothetical protein